MTERKAKIRNLFKKNSEKLDEFAISLEEYGTEGIVDEICVAKANILRRVVILLCMIWGQVSYSDKTNAIAYDKNEEYELQEYDCEYVAIFDKLFSKYGWERPYWLNFNEELTEEEKIELSEEVEQLSPDFEIGDFLFCFTNEKYDKVATLYNLLGETNEDMVREFNTISYYCDNILNPLVKFSGGIDLVLFNKEYYFFSTYYIEEDSFGIGTYVDPERLFSPELLILLPELDYLMDKFLEKWSKKGE